MPVEEYRRLRDKGKEFLTQNNPHKAQEYYTRAINMAKKLIEKDPTEFSLSFPAQEVRVTCANLTDHDEKTCKFCRKYLELGICYANRSLARCNLKDFEGALLDGEEAIALAPEWPKVHTYNII